MVDKPFPLSLEPSGDNATTGITLGLRFTATDTATIKGIGLRSPRAQSNLSARLYAVGGNGGGDGAIVKSMTGLVAVDGENFWPFDSMVVPTPGDLYCATVTIDEGGFGSLIDAPRQVDPPYETPITDYLGVFVESDTPPSTMTITTGNTTDAPWSDSKNFYGVFIYYDTDSLYDPLDFTAVRLTNTTNRIAWADADVETEYGVTIVRAPGEHTVDGNGNAFGDPGYDPTTIPGMTTAVAGQIASPYVDTIPEAGVYTYAVIRTGPGA